MAYDRTRVFLLGGYSNGDTSLIHVFDTSMYIRFCQFIWTAFNLRTQSIKYLEPKRNAANPNATQLARK